MQRFESDLAQQADQMSVILFSVITSGFFIVSFSLSHYISLFIFLTFPRCKSLTLHSFSLSLSFSPPHTLFFLISALTLTFHPPPPWAFSFVLLSYFILPHLPFILPLHSPAFVLPTATLTC